MGSVLVNFFFFLMLVVPTSFTVARLPLLVLICLGVLAKLTLTKRFRLSSEVAFIWFINIISSLFFSLWGLVHDAPGAVVVLSVFVVWPTMYLIFMGVVDDEKIFQSFLRVICVGILCSACMGLLVVASAFLGSSWLIEFLKNYMDAEVGLYDGFVEFTLPNIATLIYGAPFLMGLIVLRDRSVFLNKRGAFFIYVILALALITMLVSGRRALLVTSALSPLFLFVFSIFLPGRFRIGAFFFRGAVLTMILLTPAVIYFGINFNALFQNFLLGFDFTGSLSSDGSASVRLEQFFALLNGWAEKPLLGGGLGSFVAESERSSEQRWAYELSYVALLFHVGLVGVAVYFGSIIWVFVRSIMVMRDYPKSASYLIPVLIGFLGIIVANGTNPYFGKFDYLWTLFLPVAILNFYLTRHNNA